MSYLWAATVVDLTSSRPTINKKCKVKQTNKLSPFDYGKGTEGIYIMLSYCHKFEYNSPGINAIYLVPVNYCKEVPPQQKMLHFKRKVIVLFTLISKTNICSIQMFMLRRLVVTRKQNE